MPFNVEKIVGSFDLHVGLCYAYGPKPGGFASSLSCNNIPNVMKLSTHVQETRTCVILRIHIQILQSS